jgi:hypothetical protein
VVPTRAQDRIGTGPLSAFLILLTLLLGSANAAAASGGGIRGPSARLGSGRHGATTAVLATPVRTSSDDDASDSGADRSLTPPRPGIVARRFWTWPDAGFPAGALAAVPAPAAASYRARAPPAS